MGKNKVAVVNRQRNQRLWEQYAFHLLFTTASLCFTTVPLYKANDPYIWFMKAANLSAMKAEAFDKSMEMNQQSASTTEGCHQIAEEKLTEIANAIGMGNKIIKNLLEEAMVNHINIYNDHSTVKKGGNAIKAVTNHNNQMELSPLEKIIELYERLLLTEKEKNHLLRQLLQDGQKIAGQ